MALCQGSHSIVDFNQSKLFQLPSSLCLSSSISPFTISMLANSCWFPKHVIILLIFTFWPPAPPRADISTPSPGLPAAEFVSLGACSELC